MRLISRVILILLLVAGLTGCGKQITATPNDPAPVGGTIIKSGTFGGGAVTGTVSIYDMGGGSFIIRLVSLAAPSETGLQMLPIVNGTAAATFVLRASTGNQNYNFSGSSMGMTWNKIVIHSVQQNRDLAEAPLI